MSSCRVTYTVQFFSVGDVCQKLPKVRMQTIRIIVQPIVNQHNTYGGSHLLMKSQHLPKTVIPQIPSWYEQHYV